MKPNADFTIQRVKSTDIKQITQFIRSQLIQYNIDTAQIDQQHSLVFTAENKNGECIGGVCGNIWGSCLEIDFLWISPTARKGGLGSQLIKKIESEARQLGAEKVLVETFSFQAPDFYQRQQFKEQYRISGYPKGIEKIFLEKLL